MSCYQRRLPHWHPEDRPIFLTWRLHGSWTPDERTAVPTDSTEGQKFCLIDRAMDRTKSGPRWLKDPRVADCVVEALHVGEKWGLYELCAWVVMANHVHVLLKPQKPLASITQAIKRMSARQGNLILGRTGQPFWQIESYDHWVRTEVEFERIARYIEDNPVKAGLVGRTFDWPWSSASFENRLVCRSGICVTGPGPPPSSSSPRLPGAISNSDRNGLRR